MTDQIGVSVDPGGGSPKGADGHTGVALWDWCPHHSVWRPFHTTEMEADQYTDFIARHLTEETAAWVAMESFHLFNDKAVQQTGSTFGMVELIGVTRHMCRWFGVDFTTVSPSTRNVALTKTQSVGFKWRPRTNDHEKSAVCVGLVAINWRASTHQPGDGIGLCCRKSTPAKIR